MLVYVVKYYKVLKAGRLKQALVKLNDKCGNCPKLESHAFNGLCGDNCTFDPKFILKKLIENQVKEEVKIIDWKEIEEIRYPHLFNEQWVLTL